MDDERKLQLMKETIAEAKKSKHEDDRPHPVVGAILTDDEGNILLRAHRGENNDGGHAEYTLLKKANSKKLDLRGTTLFVSLEPCTRRGPGKTPCAVRIAESGIQRVFIGTIDPNPAIIGRGELFLTTSGLEVDRFPHSLAKELYSLNEPFMSEHLHYVAPLVEGSHSRVLAGNREALLQASLDMIVASDGPVWIFSGASSWVRELQVGLLYAAMKGRQVRIVCESPDLTEKFEMSRSAAIGAGAEVGISDSTLGIRGTLVSPSLEAEMISIERHPTLHGFKLAMPHETGVLAGMISLFATEWSHSSQKRGGDKPIVKKLDLSFIENTLRSRISLYKFARFEIATIALADLTLLSKNVERFKLYRIGVLEQIKSLYDLPEMGHIQGSPWPYLLPIVEETTGGKKVVIDGAHRVFYANDKNLKALPVILVRNVGQPLPSEPIDDLDQVTVTSDKWLRERRYVHFQPAYFRPIRKAFEDELWQSIKFQQS